MLRLGTVGSELLGIAQMAYPSIEVVKGLRLGGFEAAELGNHLAFGGAPVEPFVFPLPEDGDHKSVARLVSDPEARHLVEPLVPLKVRTPRGVSLNNGGQDGVEVLLDEGLDKYAKLVLECIGAVVL
eukprot:3034651-Prymnesium_polylepis.1